MLCRAALGGLGDTDDQLVGADRTRGQHAAVEHEVGQASSSRRSLRLAGSPSARVRDHDRAPAERRPPPAAVTARSFRAMETRRRRGRADRPARRARPAAPALRRSRRRAEGSSPWISRCSAQAHRAVLRDPGEQSRQAGGVWSARSFLATRPVASWVCPSGAPSRDRAVRRAARPRGTARTRPSRRARRHGPVHAPASRRSHARPPPARRSRGSRCSAQQPRAFDVAASPEPVQQRDRPAGVGEPVRGAPGAVSEPPARRLVTSPRAAGRRRSRRARARTAGSCPTNGMTRVDQRDRREAVEHRRDDVHEQEHERQQRDVAVQRVHHEARPARAAEAAHVDHAKATLSVSSSSATAPVERVRYQ